MVLPSDPYIVCSMQRRPLYVFTIWLTGYTLLRNAEESIASDSGDHSSTSTDSFSISTRRPPSVAGAPSRGSSPSVLFVQHRPPAPPELLSPASALRPDDRITAAEFRREVRHIDGALVIGGRPFHGDVDDARSDVRRSDVINGVDPEVEYDISETDEDGGHCGISIATGLTGAGGGSTPVATSCVGSQFHRRRRRTAFTSEQVRRYNETAPSLI